MSCHSVAEQCARFTSTRPTHSPHLTAYTTVGNTHQHFRLLITTVKLGMVGNDALRVVYGLLCSNGGHVSTSHPGFSRRSLDAKRRRRDHKGPHFWRKDWQMNCCRHGTKCVPCVYVVQTSIDNVWNRGMVRQLVALAIGHGVSGWKVVAGCLLISWLSDLWTSPETHLVKEWRLFFALITWYAASTRILHIQQAQHAQFRTRYDFHEFLSLGNLCSR